MGKLVEAYVTFLGPNKKCVIDLADATNALSIDGRTTDVLIGDVIYTVDLPLAEVAKEIGANAKR